MNEFVLEPVSLPVQMNNSRHRIAAPLLYGAAALAAAALLVAAAAMTPVRSIAFNAAKSAYYYTVRYDPGGRSALASVLSQADIVFKNVAEYIVPPTYEGYEEAFVSFLPKEQDEQEPPQSEPVTADNPNVKTVNLSAQSGTYKQYSGTALINGTDFDVSSIMNDSPKLPAIDKSKPAVLIYHTHGSEQYEGGGSVLEVGDAMADEFEHLGYQTIHIRDIFDSPNFTGAYTRSLKAAEKVLDEYPSIQITLDVHRDAIETASGQVYKPTAVIDGQNTAQVMLVSGTNAKGLEHPNWRQNFLFSLAVSRTMGKDYKHLSRPVNLRADRFNTHMRDWSMLLEVGSSANTLDEAKRAGVLCARSIIKTIEN